MYQWDYEKWTPYSFPLFWQNSWSPQLDFGTCHQSHDRYNQLQELVYKFSCCPFLPIASEISRPLIIRRSLGTISKPTPSCLTSWLVNLLSSLLSKFYSKPFTPYSAAPAWIIFLVQPAWISTHFSRTSSNHSVPTKLSFLLWLSQYLPAPSPSPVQTDLLMMAAMMARESLIPSLSTDSLASASNTVVQFDPPEATIFNRQDPGRGYRTDSSDLRNDLRPTLRSDLRRDDRPASRQDLRGPDRPDSRLDESPTFAPPSLMLVLSPPLRWRIFRNSCSLSNQSLTSMFARPARLLLLLLVNVLPTWPTTATPSPTRWLTLPSSQITTTADHHPIRSTSSTWSPHYHRLSSTTVMRLVQFWPSWSGGETSTFFDSKTLQSPVGCFDIFDQILKRCWNLTVSPDWGPALRAGPTWTWLRAGNSACSAGLHAVTPVHAVTRPGTSFLRIVYNRSVTGIKYSPLWESVLRQQHVDP